MVNLMACSCIQASTSARDNRSLANRTEPKTLREWIRYLVVAGIAIWLVIWMLETSGINIL
jgi:hypothetical protein